jgi:hypothetical protein
MTQYFFGLESHGTLKLNISLLKKGERKTEVREGGKAREGEGNTHTHTHTHRERERERERQRTQTPKKI